MKWAMVLVGTTVVATIVVVGAVVVITQEDKPATATAAYQSTTAPESTTADESTTTTASTATTEPTTTTQSQEVPDLSGVWHATKIVGGQTEEGTVLISQAGTTFTLEFSDGFRCQPAAACEFDGTVGMLSDPDSGELTYVWMASNGGSADDEGGTYETSFGIQAYSDTYPEGDDTGLPATVDPSTGGEVDTSGFYVGFGQSIYRADGEEMEWDGYLLLMPSG